MGLVLGVKLGVSFDAGWRVCFWLLKRCCGCG